MTPPLALGELQRQRRLAARGRPGYQDRVLHAPLARLPAGIFHAARRHACFPSRQSRALSPTLANMASRSVGASAIVWLADGDRLRSCLAGRQATRPRPAPRLRAALAAEPVDVVVQEAESRRKKILIADMDFDHDRPGMHRRTGRRDRHQGPCRRDHRALDEWRDRLRAGACASASRC